MRYTYDKDFFTRNTPESFYWAGFIAADGCVSMQKNKTKASILAICLSAKDKAHLEKFKTSIKFTGNVKTYNRALANPASYITIHSAKICESLERFNILPRKTLTYKFPEWLKAHPLVGHFMRGYFDGDGSFYLYRNSDSTMDSLAMNVVGTNSFLISYKEVLLNNILELKLKNNIYAVGKVSLLGCKGNRKVAKIRDFLYTNSMNDIRLDRKFNIVYAEKFINMPDSFRSKKVIGIEISSGKKIIFNAIKDVADNGFEPKLVSACCLNKRKSHKKYTWAFYDKD